MGRFTGCALAMLALVGFGCGDDDGSAGTGGASGSGGAPSVCTGAATDDPNCINEDCPNISPTTGPRAMKGACCFRVSNADRAKAAWDAGELATIEFRQNALITSTQPATVGNPLIQASLAMTYESDWSNTLVRVEGIPKTGSAEVTVTIGAGRSNCDGTYSFFGEGSAPDHEGRTDGDRWAAAVMTGTWDWSTPEKLTVAPADRAPGVRWGPVAKTDGLFGYEQPSQDLYYEFTFEGASGDDVDAEALNCVGGEFDTPAWNANLVQTTFFPISELENSSVDSLTLTQNFCSFMGVGFMRPELCDEVPRVNPDGVTRPSNCPTVPTGDDIARCNVWSELPYGMCDDEHCYNGGDPVVANRDCGTADKPCCDPTGLSTEMPACNAFAIRATAVLAGAEITDEPHTNQSASNPPFPDCTMF